MGQQIGEEMDQEFTPGSHAKAGRTRQEGTPTENARSASHQQQQGGGDQRPPQSPGQTSPVIRDWASI